MSFWLCCLSLVIQLYLRLFTFLSRFPFCLILCRFSMLIYLATSLPLSLCCSHLLCVSASLFLVSVMPLCFVSFTCFHLLLCVLFPVSLVFVPVPVLCLGLSLRLRTTSCLMCIVFIFLRSLKRKSIWIFKKPKEIKSSSSFISKFLTKCLQLSLIINNNALILLHRHKTAYCSCLFSMILCSVTNSMSISPASALKYPLSLLHCGRLIWSQQRVTILLRHRTVEKYIEHLQCN